MREMRLCNRVAFPFFQKAGIFKLEKAVEWKEKRKVVNTNIHQVKAIRSWSTNLMYKGELVKVVKFEEKYKKRKEEKTDIIYVTSTNLDLSNQTINKKFIANGIQKTMDLMN